MPKTDDEGQHPPEPTPKRETLHRTSKDPDRRLRLAAREHFRMAPSFCIRPELAGDYTLRRKRYEFLGDSDPGTATHWDILSHHPDFEEAERKLRLITSAPVFYDDRGKQASYQARGEEDFNVPEDDDRAIRFSRIAFRTACRLRPAGARTLRNATLTLLWRLGLKPVEGFEHFAKHR